MNVSLFDMDIITLDRDRPYAFVF